jgi:hypothetical protein
MSSEITAEMIEDVFGKHSDSVRFANFCNAVVMAEGSASATAIPILSEKPGADGGMDAEWTIPANVSSDFKSPFGLPGWNVFQYKARSIAGDGRHRALSSLCNDLKGAQAKLIGRLPQPKECCQYSLFTNLQLGLETATKTRDEKLLQQQRAQLTNAIAEGDNGKTLVKIFDAAQLAAIVNAHPALRLTYFSGPVAKPWSEAWAAEQRIKDYKISVPLIGRNPELKQLGEWLQNTGTKVIVLCGPSGTARRLGQSPPRRLWRDVFDYVARLMEIRFKLTQSEDEEMSLYLHLNKPLPHELIPLGERTLQEIDITRSESYHCNQIAIGIAKTDLEKGFDLLGKRVAVLNKADWREWTGGWNPFDTYGGHEFWDYLRSQNPAVSEFVTSKQVSITLQGRGAGAGEGSP